MPELTRTPLSKGYLIEGYRIERLLGGGGFSLVYLASQIKNKQTVVIKEYFPSDLVDRLPGGKVVPRDDEKLKSYRLGIKRFFNEAIALSKLEHPNIVHVQNFFRYNDTVYYVMNYERGRDIAGLSSEAPGAWATNSCGRYFLRLHWACGNCTRTAFCISTSNPRTFCFVRAASHCCLISARFNRW